MRTLGPYEEEKCHLQRFGYSTKKREKAYNEKENIHYTLTVKWRKSENNKKSWWNKQKEGRKTNNYKDKKQWKKLYKMKEKVTRK